MNSKPPKDDVLTLTLQNVILYESMLAPSAGQQVGVICITRPVLQGQGPLNDVHIKVNVWFVVDPNTPFYSLIEKERDNFRAAAAGIVKPNLVIAPKSEH